jgi:hypothetical protein
MYRPPYATILRNTTAISQRIAFCQRIAFAFMSIIPPSDAHFAFGILPVTWTNGRGEIYPDPIDLRIAYVNVVSEGLLQVGQNYGEIQFYFGEVY